MTPLRSPFVLSALAVLAIGGMFLWSIEAISLGWLTAYLPWLVLLACPLMHVFMHGGHQHGGHQQSGEAGPPSPTASIPEANDLAARAGDPNQP